MTADDIVTGLKALADPERGKASQWFFKTGPGEYGQGDRFLGIRVPELRRLAREYRQLPIEQMIELLHSEYHEARLLALLLLVRAYSKGDDLQRRRIFELYLDNTRYINNWDLVDSSAHFIVGDYLMNRSRKRLYSLARSKSLWERRIAIISTFRFIREEDFDDALAIAEILLSDREDLIHKGVGWMLREIGNRDRMVEEKFLNEHYRRMPRTMLRYAIEKFPEMRRQEYLKGTVR
jgi:3-methyladenine DNA glycosylase AlkD